MTANAIESLRADSAWLLEVAPTFTAEEWAAPSDCEGWRVQDVVAHLTQVFRQVVDPASLPAGDPSGLTERNQDRYVDAMRDLSGPQVLEQYRSLADGGIAALEAMQGNDTVVPLGDLGSHPLHVLGNAIAFDHYTHIRIDILRPTGPVDRPAPPADDLRLDATLEWLLSGLPQMTPDAFTWLDTEVNLVLDGPGARTVHVTPNGDGTVSVAPGEAGAGAASVHTSSTDFVIWSTRRRPWRELDVRLEGLKDVAERFCDSVRLF